MAAVFNELFEGGTNGAGLTSGNTTYSSFTGTPTFDNSAYVEGSQSARFDGTGSNSVVAQQSLPGSVTTRYMRRYFRLSALGTTSVTLVRLRTSSTSATIAQVVVTTGGNLQIRDGNTTIATSTNTITLNTWFRVEWFANGAGSTQTLNIFLLGNYSGNTPTETLTGAFTSGAFDRVQDGIGTASLAGTLWLDAATDSDSAYPGAVTGAAAAPTANAGPDQTVAASSVVTLDGTGSGDSDGSVVSYSWKQTSGTAVTLSSANVAQPTFTAPSGGTTVVFSLVAIDNQGAGSNADTVSITVNAPPTPAFNETFETGPSGATITTSNTTYSTVTGTAAFDSTTQAAGSLSAKLVSTGTAITLRETFTSMGERYFRRYFRVSAYASSGNIVTLMRIRLSSTTVGQVVMTSGGQLQLRDTGNVTVATSVSSLPLNNWVRVEWHMATTGTLQEMRYYTGPLLHSAVTPTETLSGAYTGGSFDRIEDGVGTASYTGTLWIDAAQDQLAIWPGPASGANQPPVANAGPDQTVLPGQTVALNGTGSTDPENAALTYSWSQTAGPSVVLSSASSVTPTFTAPYNASTTALVFSLTVSDAGGSASLADTVTITVQAANEFVLRGGTWQVAGSQLM